MRVGVATLATGQNGRAINTTCPLAVIVRTGDAVALAKKIDGSPPTWIMDFIDCVVPTWLAFTASRFHCQFFDQSDSFTIASLIISMARDGSSPLGQTSVQFMIARQRNNR